MSHDDHSDPSEDVADLKAIANALAAQVASLTGQLDQLAGAVEELRHSRSTARDEPTASPPFILRLTGDDLRQELAALTRWIEELLLPVYGREVTSSAPWCASWAQHPEAIARFHACWLAWQGLTDPRTGGVTGPSIWQRDHLDPMWRELRSPQGPFASCMSQPGEFRHELLPTPDTGRRDQLAADRESA